MLRLDYVSCLLTVLSTVLVGRRVWQGWLVAGLNSLLICWIGLETGQDGFIPANVFCLLLYAANLHAWRGHAHPAGVTPPEPEPACTLRYLPSAHTSASGRISARPGACRSSQSRAVVRTRTRALPAY